jgi:hypothetical protein
VTNAATAWRFRVRCRKGERWYFHVMVQPTVKAMMEYDAERVRAHPKLKSKDRDGGRFCAKTYVWSGDSRPSPYCLGEILLNRQDLQFEYVAHEATHAALRWAKVDKADNRSIYLDRREPEEAVCGVVGRLTQCIIVRMQRLAKKEKRRR